MNTDKDAFIEYMQSMNGGGAGGLGCLVILLTLVVTAAGAWYGITLFPDGTYPQMVLAIPGLLLGGLFFVFGAFVAFQIKHPKK